jgi:O-antigen ligase
MMQPASQTLVFQQRHSGAFDFLGVAIGGAAMLAIGGPALLAFNVPPSATFLNQAFALAGWGAFAGLLAAGAAGSGLRWPAVPGLRPVLVALLLMFLSAVGAAVAGASLPWALALSSAGLIASAAVVAAVGAAVQRSGRGEGAFEAFCGALLVAGLLSLGVAVVQYFFPDAADGNWIARPATAGRVGGNLRQPNHLSSLLLWSLVALVWLHEKRSGLLSRLPWRMGPGLCVLVWTGLVFGAVLTVSRTGMVCVGLLALWGVVDRRLSRFARVMLWLTPLIYFLGWVGLSAWSEANVHAFSGSDQLHKADLSSSRFGIWSNTLDLIRSHPWFGVGWGEFNFAWSLTPFPGRPVAFFDHTHNLPLQLTVEMGIPLALGAMLLLGVGLWRAGKACLDADSATGRQTARCAFIMVLMMVVHSQLEYPLWYAYFLLPTAFAFGTGLGLGGEPPAPQAAEAVPPASAGGPWPARLLVAASVAMGLGAAASVFDYLRVVAIFSPPADAEPLASRIAIGQRSWFFAHHADYAAATTAERPSAAIRAFDRSPHYLLDTRLMTAWARAFDELGDVQRARHLAQRMREFRNPQSDEFFAACQDAPASGDPLPFQCTPPTRTFSPDDFRQR